MNRTKPMAMLVIGSSLLLAACQPKMGALTVLNASTQPLTNVSTLPESNLTTTNTAIIPPSDGSGTSNANTVGESMFARQGEWIFHANESSEQGIIRKKIDGTEQSVLIQKSARWLNLIGDWLYFVDMSSNGNIARVKTDGTGYEVIHNSMVTDLIGGGEWLYFIDITKDRRIHKIRTDGSELTKLDNRGKVTRLLLEDDWLIWSYFLDNNMVSQDISTTRIDGTNNNMGGLSEELINAMTVGEGYIFYHTTSQGRTDFILRKTITGSSGAIHRFLPSEGITLIGVYKGWLYFNDLAQEEIIIDPNGVRSTRKGISRIRVDGSDRQVVVGPGHYGTVQFLGDQMIVYDFYFPKQGYWIMDLDGSNVRDFRK